MSRRSLWEYLQQVRAIEHATLFMTTHELEEAYIDLLRMSAGGAA